MNGHLCCLFLEHFPRSKEQHPSSYYSSHNFRTHPSSPPGNHKSPSCQSRLAYCGQFISVDHRVSLASFTLYKMCGSRSQKWISWYGQITHHCVAMLQFVYSCIACWMFGAFHCRVIWNVATLISGFTSGFESLCWHMLSAPLDRVRHRTAH